MSVFFITATGAELVRYHVSGVDGDSL